MFFQLRLLHFSASHLWRRCYFSHFKLKKQLCAHEVKIGLSEKQIIKIPRNCQFFCLQGTLSIRIELQRSKKDPIMQFILVLLVIFILVCTLSITRLDILRLSYIFTQSIGQELVYINPFLVSVLILYPLKTPGNQKASNVFRGYKMRTMARNGLIKFIIPR